MDDNSKLFSEDSDPSGPSDANGSTTDPSPVCNCGAGAHATDPGRCARGHAIGWNTIARKGPAPARVIDIAKLLDKLLIEYQPQTTFLRETCTELARSLVEVKTLDSGSTEWQRAWNTSLELQRVLEASRSKTIAVTDEHYAAMSTSELGEEISKLLHAVLDQERAERERASSIDAAGAPSAVSVEPAGEAATPTSAPAPTQCAYCHRTPCVGPNHFAFDALHYNDPIEIAKRDERATREMYAQIGKPFPDWYR
jgi:hypothetical protein